MSEIERSEVKKKEKKEIKTDVSAASNVQDFEQCNSFFPLHSTFIFG